MGSAWQEAVPQRSQSRLDGLPAAQPPTRCALCRIRPFVGRQSATIKSRFEVLRLTTRLPVRTALLLWTLFGLICFGLGYPILNRYNPAALAGTSDAAAYTSLVKTSLGFPSYRPLVPALAKPFYWMANGRVASWNPALFGMLAAASILTAATAIVIVAIGLRCGFSYATSLLAALLFLVNFAVPNWFLAAYIDSGEAFFLALVTWSLLSARWWLLPLWAIPGSLSKETFAPFAVIFALVWWLADRPLRRRRLAWIAALAVLASLTLLLTFSAPGRLFSGIAHFTTEMDAYPRVGFLHAFLACLTAREFWYIFIWLLPLGLVRLNRTDRRWIWSAASVFFLALLLGAYNNAQGNTARALFNITGPLLSLSAAALLTDSKSETARSAASTPSSLER